MDQNLQKLQTSWPNGLDINGLNKEDQIRIIKIGFEKWLEEISARRRD